MRSTNGIRHRGPIPSQKGDRERQAGSNDPAHAQDLLAVATALLAAAALLATAQSGAADDPEASVRTFNGANDVTQVCQTPQRVGVPGAFGAGALRRRLHREAHVPLAPQHVQDGGTSLIRTQNFLGHKVTLNSRIRAFLAGGTEIHHRDVSCAVTTNAVRSTFSSSAVVSTSPSSATASARAAVATPRR